MGRDKDKNPEYFIDNTSIGPEPQIPMTGRVARMHNITYVPLTVNESVEHVNAIDQAYFTRYTLHRDEPLFTEQEHFGTRGIRHYVDNPDSPTEYAHSHPEVYPDRDGDLWINEGHHRIIASRLRGEPYIDVLKYEPTWD